MRSRFIPGALVLAVFATASGCGSNTTETPTPTVTTTTYTSVMNGNNEEPSRATPATGTATYTLTGNILTFQVSATGLTAPVTQGHIHGPAAAKVNASVIIPFVVNPVTSGTVTSGTVDLSLPLGTTNVTGDSLKKLLNAGLLYTNVHTSTYPGGEIRGQIVKQ